MLPVISALEGFPLDSTDGRIGVVTDFLFDDASWRVRWLVVECGVWLKGRKVLIPPSAVAPFRLDDQRFDTKLTRAQVAAGPELSDDEPVSQQMEQRAYSSYSLAPEWDSPYLGGLPGAITSEFVTAPYFGIGEEELAGAGGVEQPQGDSHLRSVKEVTGYHIRARDGTVGHVENFLLDLETWKLRYFVVDTRNWGFGKHVLMSFTAVTGIQWSDREVALDVTREQVKSSPTWDPLVGFDELQRHDLHEHYGWPGAV